MQVPDTEFAHCGEVQIAYQVYGAGPLELVVCGGPAGHVEVFWEEPLVHKWYERIGSFARVAVFDRRGTGLSDSAEGPPSDSQYMRDLEGVIDACGFERPALLGVAEASRMCALFAATHPERVGALVLVDTAAAGRQVLNEPLVRWLSDTIEERWGKGEITALYAPSLMDHARHRRWLARLERLSVSPRGARQLLEMALESDVSEALPRIACPTLVIHHRDNALVPVELGRAVAQAIPGARFATVGGRDSMIWLGDAEALVGEVEEFLTGARTPGPCSELAAILFTDIVGSTELAAQLHHEQWQQLLGEHDELVRREIELAGGTPVKAIGDGFLATFPTPAEAVRAAAEAMGAAAGLGLQLRAGVHVGAVERRPLDVRGIAVHIAARISELARGGQILVSGTVRDILIDSGLPLVEVSSQRLRGVPGEWPLYELSRAPAHASRAVRQLRVVGEAAPARRPMALGPD